MLQIEKQSLNGVLKLKWQRKERNTRIKANHTWTGGKSAKKEWTQNQYKQEAEADEAEDSAQEKDHQAKDHQAKEAHHKEDKTPKPSSHFPLTNF